MQRYPLLYSRRRLRGKRTDAGDEYMSKADQGTGISDAELRADGKADSIAAVLLVALAVATMVYWVAGH